MRFTRRRTSGGLHPFPAHQCPQPKGRHLVLVSGHTGPGDFAGNNCEFIFLWLQRTTQGFQSIHNIIYFNKIYYRK